MAVEAVWPLLARAATFDLIIRGHSTNDPVHRGRGRITVESSGDVITWHEHGEWEMGTLAGIRFSNTTRWGRAGTGELRVSHQRRGGPPVFLSTLREGSPGQWTGDPHLCGADCYTPVLLPTADHLFLAWDVTSPTDPYRWEMQVR
jgi:hypothetical protein